jgi:cyclase
MLSTRVIPCLLLLSEALVKTVRFEKPDYIGDPINTVRIFNELEVDELIFLDISAPREKSGPPYQLLAEIATECFMPFAYGGGIQSVEDMRRLFTLGAEKISVNTHAFRNPRLITEAADRFGSQSVIVSIDVKRQWGRYEVMVEGGRRSTSMDPVAYARKVEALGAGEILLTSIDRDGTMAGYDTDLIRRVTDSVGIPVIACGGAGHVAHFGEAVKQGGAAAVAAGSLLVYQGKGLGVLVSFPDRSELEAVLGT